VQGLHLGALHFFTMPWGADSEPSGNQGIQRSTMNRSYNRDFGLHHKAHLQPRRKALLFLVVRLKLQKGKIIRELYDIAAGVLLVTEAGSTPGIFQDVARTRWQGSTPQAAGWSLWGIWPIK
jgi:hypothetical protein